MACNLVLIAPKDVAPLWDNIAPLIAAAMHKTQLSDFEVLKHQLHRGQALLWVAADGARLKAAAATQVSIVNGNKYCTIIACGGAGRRGWLQLIRGLEDYARDENCLAMRIFGRPGWSRVLPEYNIVGYITERKLLT